MGAGWLIHSLTIGGLCAVYRVGAGKILSRAATGRLLKRCRLPGAALKKFIGKNIPRKKFIEKILIGAGERFSLHPPRAFGAFLGATRRLIKITGASMGQTRFASGRQLDLICLGRLGVDLYAQQVGALSLIHI